MTMILSVARSGTRFTKKMLDDHSVPYQHMHFWGRNDVPEFDGIVIVPMRHRDICRKSWLKHYSYYDKNFNTVWDEMTAYVRRHHNAFPLRIMDKDLRDLDLHRISSALGVSLSVDWSIKVGEGKP